VVKRWHNKNNWTKTEMPAQRLKIAIQKSGRLADDSLKLLAKCGISLTRGKDQLFCTSPNFPLDIYFVRDDDIPSFVSSHTCQIGIVGENILNENKFNEFTPEMSDLDTIMPLGFGKCRLSLAAPNDLKYVTIKDIEKKTIATSYPFTLKNFLREQNIDARIVTMSGAVEIAPRIKMADAICDLVSTGGTLVANGLKELDVIVQSQAVLIKNNNLQPPENDILNRFIMRIKGVMEAEQRKYIMLNAPISALESIKKILPGSDSPTIIPLQGRDDMVAIHAVCMENVFWETMEDLKSCGASAILVVPIEKMLN
jgi:ATP phosphoribosyltransferase